MDSTPSPARSPLSLCHAMRELSNPMHWCVLWQTARQPQTVSGICEAVPWTLSAVSRSLKTLASYGFVSFVADKQLHIYRVNRELVQIHDMNVSVLVLASDGGIRVEWSAAQLALPFAV